MNGNPVGDARTVSTSPGQKRMASSILNPSIPFTTRLKIMAPGTILDAFLTSSDIFEHLCQLNDKIIHTRILPNLRELWHQPLQILKLYISNPKVRVGDV